jgi:hypothetical protein
MIDFTEVVTYILSLVAAGVGTMLMIAFKNLAAKFGVEVDEKQNAKLNEAIERALGFANEKLTQNGKKLTFETENEFIANAANYVVSGVPKAMQHFGLTRERVVELVESRIAGKVPKVEAEPVE